MRNNNLLLFNCHGSSTKPSSSSTTTVSFIYYYSEYIKNVIFLSLILLISFDCTSMIIQDLSSLSLLTSNKNIFNHNNHHNNLISKSSSSLILFVNGQQACYINIDSTQIIDVTNASSPFGYYKVINEQSSSPSTSTTTTDEYILQICNYVTNFSLCNSGDKLSSVAFQIENSYCKPLSNTGQPTVKLIQNTTNILGVSLIYTPFGVGNLFRGTNIDIYCDLYFDEYLKTNNLSLNLIQTENVIFKKKSTNVLTTTYYFEMYSKYACPKNGTIPITNQSEFKEFYQMFLSICFISILVIGLCHLIVSLFSYRVFNFNLFTLLIPLISFIIGCLYCFLEVLIYSIAISGIYVSIGITMSPLEVTIYIIIAVVPLVFNASGLFSRRRLEFF